MALGEFHGVVEEAVPEGRWPYILAQMTIDRAVAAGALEDRGQPQPDLVPMVRRTYATLSQAMAEDALDPPIESDSRLGRSIEEFHVVYSGKFHSGYSIGQADVKKSVKLLYAVTDYGVRSESVSNVRGVRN